jgi:hypothetical protein
MMEVVDAPLPSLAVLHARTLSSWLMRTFESPAVLDMSFPTLSFGAPGLACMTGVADTGKLPAAASAFFRRFRASGGNQPLLGLDRNTDDLLLAEPASPWNASGRQRLAYAEALPAPATLEALLKAEAWLLFRDGIDDPAAAPALKHLGVVRLDLCCGRHVTSYSLLLPQESVEEQWHKLSSAAGVLGHDVTHTAYRSGKGLIQIEIAPPEPDAEGRLLAEIQASDMIHDGQYRSEKEGTYSWLWSGPERHLRIALGSLPYAARWLKVVLIGVVETGLLDALTVSLNGLRLPHRLERWSAVSAGVVVDLPRDWPSDLVLGVAVPRTAREDEGDRRLGVCLHKIEVFA